MGVCQPRYITEENSASLRFSVCTLVASEKKYRRMLASFAERGFDEENSEFIALDNRVENRFDGFRALRRVFPECRGDYILLTHDDIELLDDGAEQLLAALGELDRRDPYWAVAGNAGVTLGEPERLVLHLSDPHGSFRDADTPIEVQALDENFLILRRANMVFPSMDLEGFHLFAVDLCLQARFAGGRSYVIPFYLRHYSGGNQSEALTLATRRFSDKFADLRIPTRIRSPASTIYIGRQGVLRRVIDETVAYVAAKKERAIRRMLGKDGSGILRGKHHKASD